MKILNPKERFVIQFYVKRTVSTKRFLTIIKKLDRRKAKYVMCKHKDSVEILVTTDFKNAKAITKIFRQ